MRPPRGGEKRGWWMIVPCARVKKDSRIVTKTAFFFFISEKKFTRARESRKYSTERSECWTKRCPRTKEDPDANEDTGRTTPSRLTLTDSVHDWWNVRPQRACTRETPFLSDSPSPHHARCSREKGQWFSIERATTPTYVPGDSRMMQ